MAAVNLTILEPENNTAFIGAPTITFRCQAEIPAELTDTPMYYRWYSSLYPAEEGRYSINDPALTDPDTSFSYTPPAEISFLGSHAITLATSDQAGESSADFEAIQHGGVAGGAEGEGQCLIHVFEANIITPVSAAEVTRTAIVLEAQAPTAWGVSEDLDTGGPPYIFNEDYGVYNRLQYRWLFEPVGSPADRPSHEFIPAPEDMAFDPELVPVGVRYTASLPVTSPASTGLYRIMLFVEDNKGEGLGEDSSQVEVTITG